MFFETNRIIFTDSYKTQAYIDNIIVIKLKFEMGGEPWTTSRVALAITSLRRESHENSCLHAVMMSIEHINMCVLINEI